MGLLAYGTKTKQGLVLVKSSAQKSFFFFFNSTEMTDY